MSMCLTTPETAAAERWRPRREPPLRCAFVNNMPDPAFVSTERQYLGLLEAGVSASGVDLEVRCYRFEALPRSPEVLDHATGRYFPLGDLWAHRPDLVVVTGSEPGAERVDDEPYWDETVALLRGLAGQPTSLLLSCLAAHVALRALDGLERGPLPAKRTGVFAHRPDRHSPLAAGMGSPVPMPQSRLNDVPSQALADAGYDLVLASDDAGWAAATGAQHGLDLLLLQGHPEYDPSSLLREYRRDARRYLTGERAALPVLPGGCVAAADAEALADLHATIVGGSRDAAVLDRFDFRRAAQRVPWPWRTPAVQLYANWIGRAAARAAAGAAVAPAAR